MSSVPVVDCQAQSSFNVFTMTAVNIDFSIFLHDFYVLSDGVIMRLHTPVSFIKAIRNLFDVFDTAHQLSGYAIGSLGNRTQAQVS